MDRTCDKCGQVFPLPCRLRAHRARKTPCDPILLSAPPAPDEQAKDLACKYCGRSFTSKTNMYRHVRQSCKIANSEEGMEKLFEHTLQRQMAAQTQEVSELRAQVSRLTSLLERQLVPALPRQSPKTGSGGEGCPGGEARTYVQHADQVNTGSVVTNIQQNIVAILPWDGEKRIDVGVAQIAAAFAENARLREYARMGDHELTDPEIAPPYVTELLMDLVKRGHADPTARNVYLNPRRADQVLVHMKSGLWEVLPLAEATRLLLDGVAQGIHQVVMTYAELRQLPLEAQNAMSMAGMMYGGEPEEYVKRAKGPMTAHLVNTKPESEGQ